ncbi:MAG: 2-hydroxyacyl-CoA dehydratase [Chloroflexi bacterium]|nr:2-hydroxyacyl-CoA dehydratase [Chloroflexota bacterium]
MGRRIGITTTIPVEIMLAAGHLPIDLNNTFITSKNPDYLIKLAEQDGFPLNCCAWIKGIYGSVLEDKPDSVICVTSGDCSNTEMLMEVLKLKGISATSFAYPPHPNPEQMKEALEKLAFEMGTTIEVAEKVRVKLQPVRAKVLELDRLTWQEGVFNGWSNHYWLVSCSDFNSDATAFSSDLSKELMNSHNRQPFPEDTLRLAYVGVPPIFGRDLYRFTEEKGAQVVYNEVQRQFAMPMGGDSLAEQYSNYTYPYSIHQRIADIKAEIDKRQVDAVIHYVQSFCHRAIGDIIIRDALSLPVLTIEGNNEMYINQQIETRIEAFIDVLNFKRNKSWV